MLAKSKHRTKLIINYNKSMNNYIVKDMYVAAFLQAN